MNNSCPLCESQVVSAYLTASALNYLKCSQCSMIFLSDRSSPRKSGHYSMKYIQDRGHDLKSASIIKAKEATARKYFSLMEKLAPKGNVLEIGCSTGIMLRIAQKRGWYVHGIEINVSAAQMAKRILATDYILAQPLNDDMFPGKQFSLIVLFDVIEHISDPVPFMKTLSAKLHPEGRILLVTPDIESISARLFRGKWPHFMDEHVCMYSRQTITLLLRQSGLQPVCSGWAGKCVSIEMLWRHMERHSHIMFSSTLVSLLKNLPFLGNLIIPFNIGEFYLVAARK